VEEYPQELAVLDRGSVRDGSLLDSLQPGVCDCGAAAATKAWVTLEWSGMRGDRGEKNHCRFSRKTLPSTTDEVRMLVLSI